MNVAKIGLVAEAVLPKERILVLLERLWCLGHSPMCFRLEECLCKTRMESDFRDILSCADADAGTVLDFSDDKNPIIREFVTFV